MIGKVGISLALMATVTGLSACDEISRFKQEKYECGLNPAGIVEIDLRAIKVGDSATIVTLTGDKTSEIVFRSDDELILEGADMILRIARDTGKIRTTIGTNFHELQCNKIEFRM